MSNSTQDIDQSTSDPLSFPDQEDVLERFEPSPASIQRFWMGISGLGILSLSGSFFTFLLTSSVLYSLNSLLHSNFVGLQFPLGLQNTWRLVHGVERFLAHSLVPSMLLSTIVPILFWRGGLSQRFILSAAIAVISVNVVQNWYFHDRSSGIRGMRMLQIVGCWFSLPLLLAFAPLRTKQLRFVVTSGIILLALCISILPMREAPNATDMLSWQILYATGFAFALLRRNWGNVAFTESFSDHARIERTSTWVMLELMAIVGMVTSFLLWWMRRESVHAPQMLFLPAILGIVTSLIGLYQSRSLLRSKCSAKSMIVTAMFSWFVLTLVYAPCFVSALILGFPYAWQTFSVEYLAVTSLSVGSVGSIFLVGVMWVGSLWLRFCGWRIVE